MTDRLNSDAQEVLTSSTVMTPWDRAICNRKVPWSAIAFVNSDAEVAAMAHEADDAYMRAWALRVQDPAMEASAATQALMAEHIGADVVGRYVTYERDVFNQVPTWAQIQQMTPEAQQAIGGTPESGRTQALVLALVGKCANRADGVAIATWLGQMFDVMDVLVFMHYMSVRWFGEDVRAGKVPAPLSLVTVDGDTGTVSLDRYDASLN